MSRSFSFRVHIEIVAPVGFSPQTVLAWMGGLDWHRRVPHLLRLRASPSRRTGRRCRGSPCRAPLKLGKTRVHSASPFVCVESGRETATSWNQSGPSSTTWSEGASFRGGAHLQAQVLGELPLRLALSSGNVTSDLIIGTGFHLQPRGWLGKTQPPALVCSLLGMAPPRSHLLKGMLGVS